MERSGGDGPPWKGAVRQGGAHGEMAWAGGAREGHDLGPPQRFHLWSLLFEQTTTSLTCP
jgi:hypothetical protein